MHDIIDDIGNFIFLEDEPFQCDIIFTVGGSYPEVPEKAAELYRQGYAGLVMAGGKYSVKTGCFRGVQSKADRYCGNYETECDFYEDVLIQNGVPQTAVLKEDQSGWTRENAEFARKVTDEKRIQVKSAIIVCKRFHARRCLMFYQAAFPEAEFRVIPADLAGEHYPTRENWFQTQKGIDRVLGELLRCGNQFGAEDIRKFRQRGIGSSTVQLGEEQKACHLKQRDFIFIIGPSGVGKSTLTKKLYEHYRSTYLEQSQAPEFITRDGRKEVAGLLEEETCWQWTLSTLMCYHRLGYKNIICCDFDDLRTRDIPEVFKGYNYITIKLECSDYAQNYEQMKNRGQGLIDFELLEKCSAKMSQRPLLINEFALDVKGKTPDEVCGEAVRLIETAETCLDYEYEKPPRELFYSWVFANGLR